MKKACLPYSFQIVIDDVGWRCGRDTRYKGGPSRSGLETRHHALEDYQAIIALGKNLNMRIKCAFVIGEWDRTNLLRDVPYATEFFDEWDNASRIDPRIDEFRDAINAGQEYMEIAMHGLIHEFWTGKHSGMQPEFYARDGGRPVKMLERDAARRHIEAFFELLHQNGLPENIRSFVPPNFSYIFSDSDHELSALLREYGIRYISTPYCSMRVPEGEFPEMAAVENGIITVDRSRDFTSWEIVNAPTPDKIKKSYYGMHWPNIIHDDPSRNMEVVARWTEYFRRYQRDFEIFSARENGQAASQALYKRFTRVSETPDALILDFSGVDRQGAVGLYPEVYLNFTPECRPVSSEGGICELYAAREGFNTWKLRRLEPFAERLTVSY